MNITKWFVMLALVFTLMFALTGVVMADSEVNETEDTNITQGQALTVRYDHLQCKVAFTNTQIDLLKEYVSVDQTANKDKLTSDIETLKEYVDDTDKEGFDAFLNSTLRPDLQKATQDLNTAKKNFRQYNISTDSKEALIADLKDAKEAYSDCVDDKEIKMAKVMEVHMRNWNRQWGNIIDRMEEKNITMEDAEALQAEIEARNEELKALIASGNITKIRDFMKTYHASQLEYAARFEVARLKGYRDKLEPLAEKYNMSDKLHDIDEKIANAEEHARKGYKAGEFKDSWDDIKGAGKDMKEAAKDINEERAKERQEKMNEREQKIQERQRERDSRNNTDDIEEVENEED